LEANDITKDMVPLLKKDFAKKPKALHEVITAMAQARLEYLKSLSFDDLDKKGLAEELVNRNYAAYRQKYFEKFGKEPKQLDITQANKEEVKKQIANLEALILKDGKSTQGNLNFIRTGNKKDPKNHLRILRQYADSDPNKHKTWEQMDRDGSLADFKRDHYDAFKKMYREKFGKEYKDS